MNMLILIFSSLLVVIYADCELYLDHYHYSYFPSENSSEIQYLHKSQQTYQDHQFDKMIYFITNIRNNNNNTIIFTIINIKHCAKKVVFIGSIG